MKWDEIRQEIIIIIIIIIIHFKGHDHHRDDTASINYLYFLYNHRQTEVEIDDFNMSDFNLAQLLIIYRERYNKQQLLS